MDDGVTAQALPPVLAPVYGPLDDLAARVHELTQSGRCEEALAALEIYEPFARDFGDERTAEFLLQARMFAYLYMGRVPEALAAGERLLERHESAGNAVAAAKTMAELATAYLVAERVGEAMRYLARAGLLLEQTNVRNDRYVAALGSLMTAATAGELYETAHATYQQISQWWASAGRSDVSANYDLIYADVLLEWGLRLDQLGDDTEARSRLRTAADMIARWCDAYADHNATDDDTTDSARRFDASRAPALAKVGEADRAIELAGPIVLPLRGQGDWYGAWVAHLALGIALRARGDLTAARLELLAAAELGHVNNASERLIVGFELAALAAQEVGEYVTRDLRKVIQDQARQLWQLRLQRVAMLRQARLSEEQEQTRRAAEAALLHDPLTGLGNRRRFDQMMVDVDAGQVTEPTALLVIDVDRFKAINDTHSHTAGDQVLRGIAAILAANCRAGDVPIRYAGDEFVVFLRADVASARQVAERIRVAVRDASLDHIAPGLQVSVSVGVAPLRRDMTAQDLFDAADANLYQAKRAGRDRVAS